MTKQMVKSSGFRFAIMVACICTGITCATIAKAPSKTVRWVIEQRSNLQVDGTSNVNSFSCKIGDYADKDTITCSDNSSGPVRLSGSIQMDIVSFNCHSSLITRDLRKTLKAEEYPRMTIRFLSLQSMPSMLPKAELIKGRVEVELAGVVKRFELTYSIRKTASGLIELSSDHNFRFSDFKLTPPRKLAGMVKIKDAFGVSFQLVLRAV